jgi:hypothetical protein
MSGALSDERTGLSFTTAAGTRQRSHSRVRVPWDSGPYFTVSDSRLPFSSPPTTRRVTVEVFDPASTRGPRHIASAWTAQRTLLPTALVLLRAVCCGHYVATAVVYGANTYQRLLSSCSLPSNRSTCQNMMGAGYKACRKVRNAYKILVR